MKRQEQRKLRTAADLGASGWSESRVQREVRAGLITRIIHGVYGEGNASPSALDIGRATALASDGIGVGLLAGEMLGWDNVRCVATEVVVSRTSSSKRDGVRRVRALPPFVEVDGVRCSDGATTLWELAHRLDDVVFEQAMESALRSGHVSPDDLVAMGAVRSDAGERVRRILTLRGGPLTPATDSLLETLAIQLLRTDSSIPVPLRQYEVRDEHDGWVGRPDLCWPELGVFVELDGQHHADQPVYDARRQTRIAGITGWRCGRLTWEEVTRWPNATVRELARLVVGASKVSASTFRGW